MTNTDALLDLLAQKRKEVAALEQAVTALGLSPSVREPLTGPRYSSKGHPFGNGEPDAELAAAAGIAVGGNARPDKWRKFLSLRRNGVSFWTAATKLRVHKNTAQRLESLV